MSSAIELDRTHIAEFCRRHGIRRLSLFGSVLTKRFGPDSDLDVLIEFEPDIRIGLLGMARLEIELGALVGRKVDLRTREDLSRYFRDKVMAQAEEQYAARG
jgi:predicted nucleotidyltransferase